MSDRIAVIGLGYVGLPVALALAKKFPDTVGFDINIEKVEALRQGLDRTGEVSPDDLKLSSLKITSNPDHLSKANFFIVVVPTPIDRNHRPNLAPLLKASETVG